jgi:peptidyl-tRNA hydrolase
MKLIVGLGNPGGDYAATRHNVRWCVADAFAKKFRALSSTRTMRWRVMRDSSAENAGI